jgi:hypothetical protein
MGLSLEVVREVHQRRGQPCCVIIRGDSIRNVVGNDVDACSSVGRGRARRSPPLASSSATVSGPKCISALPRSWTASLAILASVGEIDPLGTRRDGLAAFLDQKVEEGYVIETRTDTHAIISRRPRGLKRFTSGADPGRYVVEVDEDGIATMRAAEPRRT